MSHSAQNDRARLRQQVFLYIASCIRRGQIRDLCRLSLRPDQIRRIGDLKAHDLIALGELSGPSIRFDIDPDALDQVFQALADKQSRELLIERCLRRDAPRAMMQQCFGISRHRYVLLRRKFGVPERRGRPPKPSERALTEIHRIGCLHGTAPTATKLLDIAETLDISLRIVWDELSRQ